MFHWLPVAMLLVGGPAPERSRTPAPRFEPAAETRDALALSLGGWLLGLEAGAVLSVVPVVLVFGVYFTALNWYVSALQVDTIGAAIVVFVILFYALVFGLTVLPAITYVSSALAVAELGAFIGFAIGAWRFSRARKWPVSAALVASVPAVACVGAACVIPTGATFVSCSLFQATREDFWWYGGFCCLATPLVVLAATTLNTLFLRPAIFYAQLKGLRHDDPNALDALEWMDEEHRKSAAAR